MNWEPAASGRRTSGTRWLGHRQRRHRQDHDLPARGAQRLPARRRSSSCRTPSSVARNDPRRRRDRAHRRGARRVLLRWRPAHPRRRRLRRRRRHRPPQRARPPGPDPARCPSRSSRWSRATRSAAGTCCTSCATSRSPPTTRASARPVRGSARSTAATARACWRASVGQKKAREIWFLCRQYDAQEALDMGLVNTVVPLEELEEETVAWCRQMLEHSPLALRMIKASCNAADDGLAGIQQLAGDATLLYYMGEEAQEGKRRLPREAQARLRPVPQAPVSAPRPHSASTWSVVAHFDADARGRRRMTSASLWVQGARPRTLGAAVAPVLVGTAAAVAEADGVIWWRAALRAGRGARAAGRRQLRQRLLRRRARHRQGPQGPGAAHRDRDWPRPARSSAAAFLSFGVAAVAGLVLSLVVNPWLLLVGVAAIAAAVALHRRTEAVRLPRLSARSWCWCSSGSWPRSAPRTCRSSEVPAAAWWGSLVVGPARLRDPARQQRARRRPPTR